MGKSGRSPRDSSPDFKRAKADTGDDGVTKKERKALLKKKMELEREQAAIAARLGLRDEEMDSISDDASSLRPQQQMVPVPPAPQPSGDLAENPMMDQILSSLNALTVNVQTLNDGMTHLRKDMDSQRSQVDRVLEHVHKLEAKTTKDFQDYKDSAEKANEAINKKIASMEQRLQGGRPSSAGASGSAAAAASPTPPPTSTAPAARQPGDRVPGRVWIKGFREVLTTKQQVEFIKKEVLPKLPTDLREGARAGTPGFGSACYVDLSNDKSAGRARELLSDAALTWETFREGTVALRVSGDQAIAVRHRGLFLGELWGRTKEHLIINTAKLHLKPEEIKLGQSRGRLYFIWQGPPRELFATASPDSTGLECTANYPVLADLLVDQALADSWVSAARAAASRLRK